MKLKSHQVLSNFAFNFSLRRYTKAKKAEAVRLRASAEAIAKAKFDAGMSLTNLRNAKVGRVVQVRYQSLC